MNNGDKDKNQKSTAKTVAGVIIFIVVFNLLASGNIFASVALIFGIVAVVMLLAAKRGGGAAKKGTAKSAVQTEKKHYEWKHSDPDEAVTEKVYAPVQETAPQKQYYESSDVVDNYARDREQRIKQLDSFLENGIIGKDEYKTLKRKYEQSL